jgi:hypothetical protein
MDNKYEIAVLAEDYEAKRRAYEYYAMRNTYGLTPEESSELSQKYHLAQAEMMKALFVLDQAKIAYATGR